MRPHPEAKHRAEEALKASRLDYTLVKPGGLTHGPGCGRLELAAVLGRGDTSPRDDVAALVVALVVAVLLQSLARRCAFEVISGEPEMSVALAQLSTW